MSSHTSDYRKPRRNSPPTLWEQAVTLWNNMVLGYGHPHDLMRWGWMRALEHRGLGHWLRDLEKLVRRAIRMDAEDCEVPALKPSAKRAAPSPPQSNEDMPRFRRSYSDDCETWKVSFCMSPPAPHAAHTRRSRAGYQPSERRPCRNLAYRIEALRRAINHRADHVRRYALRLARIEAARLQVMADYIAQRLASAPDRDARSNQDAITQGGPALHNMLHNAKHIEPG